MLSLFLSGNVSLAKEYQLELPNSLIARSLGMRLPTYKKGMYTRPQLQQKKGIIFSKIKVYESDVIKVAYTTTVKYMFFF